MYIYIIYTYIYELGFLVELKWNDIIRVLALGVLGNPWCLLGSVGVLLVSSLKTDLWTQIIAALPRWTQGQRFEFWRRLEQLVRVAKCGRTGSELMSRFECYQIIRWFIVQKGSIYGWCKVISPANNDQLINDVEHSWSLTLPAEQLFMRCKHKRCWGRLRLRMPGW